MKLRYTKEQRANNALSFQENVKHTVAYVNYFKFLREAVALIAL